MDERSVLAVVSAAPATGGRGASALPEAPRPVESG